MTIIEAPAAATTDDWRVVLRRYLIFAAAANLVWETAHLPLYTIWASGSARELAFAVAHCGGGDILLAMSSLVAALLLVGAGWPASGVTHKRVAALTVTLAVAATVLIEWLNVVVRQSWAYSDLMPVLPVIGTGLSPVAQWVVIPLIGLWWARLAVSAAGRGRQMDARPHPAAAGRRYRLWPLDRAPVRAGTAPKLAPAQTQKRGELGADANGNLRE